MAAYERALLLIIQHTERVKDDSNSASDFVLLLEVRILQTWHETALATFET